MIKFSVGLFLFSMVGWGNEVKKVVPGSKINREQLREVKDKINDWIMSETHATKLPPGDYLKSAETDEAVLGKLIEETNRVMTIYKLPTISRPQLKNFQISKLMGFAGAQPIGFVYAAEKTVYCLPCTYGYNDFRWGVISRGKMPKFKLKR